MLSEAELNLFMNGDPKSIDFSIGSLQDQVLFPLRLTQSQLTVTVLSRSISSLTTPV